MEEIKSRSTAMLYVGSYYRNVDEDMINYCQQNDTCRRELLMRPFVEQQATYSKPVTMHLCCDLCARQCHCTTCSANMAQGAVQRVSPIAKSVVCRPALDKHNLCRLHKELLQYWASKVSQCTIAAQLSTIKLLTGITDHMLALIAEQHNWLFSNNDVIKLCPSLSRADTVNISDIIDTYYIL